MRCSEILTQHAVFHAITARGHVRKLSSRTTLPSTRTQVPVPTHLRISSKTPKSAATKKLRPSNCGGDEISLRKSPSMTFVTPIATTDTPEAFNAFASRRAESFRKSGNGTPSDMNTARLDTFALSPFSRLKHCSLVTFRASAVLVVSPR